MISFNFLITCFALLFLLANDAIAKQPPNPCVDTIRLSDEEMRQDLRLDDDFFSAVLKSEAYYTQLKSQKCWDEMFELAGLAREDHKFEVERHWRTFQFPILVGERLCKVRRTIAYQLDENWENPGRVSQLYLVYYLDKPATEDSICESIPLDRYIEVYTDIPDDSMMVLLNNADLILKDSFTILNNVEVDVIRGSDIAVTAIGVGERNRDGRQYYYFEVDNGGKSYDAYIALDQDGRPSVVHIE